jgi:hypothetical protein
MSFMVTTTLFAREGTLLTGASLDCLAAITGDFNNDSIIEFSIFNDTSTALDIDISTESTTDPNAFPLKKGEYITLDMKPESLFIINNSVGTVNYRMLFKLRKADD